MKMAMSIGDGNSAIKDNRRWRYRGYALFRQGHAEQPAHPHEDLPHEFPINGNRRGGNRHVEKRAKESGQDLKSLSLKEMDLYWDEAKKL